MSTHLDEDRISELRKREVERLRRLPPFPAERPDDEKGVLLSDRIKYYCQNFQLVHPFHDELLEPAGYKLTVGQNYSVRGEIHALNDGMKLEIQPYQVAVIETYETINMPEFLIGRWNIRVKLAYEGLLWVGAAQVDPGFRGHLCCPIYNLSTKTVSLDFRAPLALIDFVTTTPYEEEKCKRFRWWDRKMIVFRDYPRLISGIEDQVLQFKTAIEESKRQTKEDLDKAHTSSQQAFRVIEGRIDAFVTRIFTVVAVLFTGLGIVASRGPGEPSSLVAPVFVAAVALFFALRAHATVHSSNGREAQTGKWYTQLIRRRPDSITVIILLASLIVQHHCVSAKELHQAKSQAAEARSALKQQREDFEVKIREVRQQSDAKIDGLQKEINLIQQNQIKRR